MKEAAEALRLTADYQTRVKTKLFEPIVERIGMNETIARVGKALERSLEKFDKFTLTKY